MIPAVFPLVEMHSAGSFIEQFLLIFTARVPVAHLPVLGGVGTKGVYAEAA